MEDKKVWEDISSLRPGKLPVYVAVVSWGGEGGGGQDAS